MNKIIDINLFFEYGTVSFPHRIRPTWNSKPYFTREQWEKYQWNPPQWWTDEYPDPDPGAQEKPLFSWLLEQQPGLLKEKIRLSEEHLNSDMEWNPFIQSLTPLGDRVERTTGAVELDGDTVHVHGGIDRMTGLIHMVGRADQAGSHLHHVAMRDDDGSILSLHSQSQVWPILDAVAERKNRVESAHNQVMQGYHEIVSVRDDDRQPIGVRLRKAEEAAEYVRNYRSHLDREIAAYDPAALPSGLSDLRAVYIGRLEAAATGHQKALKGALTQQAIDNWAACVEIGNALAEIALECAVGVQRIANAEHDAWKKVSGSWEKTLPRTGPVDHEGEGPPEDSLGNDRDIYRDTGSGGVNARAAFDAAVAAIVAVTPVNVPEITHNLSGRRLTIRAAHPATDPPIRGPVSEASSGVVATDGSDIVGQVAVTATLPAKDADPRTTHYLFKMGFAGRVRITATFRNICGPSAITLELNVPAQGRVKLAA